MKKLLIVVDYQNDFVIGGLGFPRAKQIQENVINKINKYKENKDDVLFTFDTHHENYLNTLEGKNLPVSHCIFGTSGWNLYDKVANLISSEDTIIKKNTFGSKDLVAFLENKTYQSIEIIGVVTNICVISNAIIAKAAVPETPIYIDASAVAGFDLDMHNKALDVLESMQFIVTNRF